MNKLEQLKEVIIKAVPEIKLKGRKGCIAGSLCPDCGEELGNDNETIFCPKCSFLHSDKTGELSRPITLEDVLVAIKKKKKEHQRSPYLRFDGVFFEWSNFYGEDEHRVKPTFIKWKLGQPLDQQDEPTLSFLHEILCKNTDKDKEH